MRLPIAIVNKDGHIWIRCMHIACVSDREGHGFLHRLNNGDHAGNGEKLDDAIQHSIKLHGQGGE